MRTCPDVEYKELAQASLSLNSISLEAFRDTIGGTMNLQIKHLSDTRADGISLYNWMAPTGLDQAHDVRSGAGIL